VTRGIQAEFNEIIGGESKEFGHYLEYVNE
jgi:hypothetical protein